MRPSHVLYLATTLQLCSAGWVAASSKSIEEASSHARGVLTEEYSALAQALRQNPPKRPRTVDALGEPVSAEVWGEYVALLKTFRKRTLSQVEKDLILALLNQPSVSAAPFKDRGALVRHFARIGVAIPQNQPGLQDSDLWRLVRAVRAASVAFRIPPAILMCLTFRESSFNPRASAWTTSAKGVAQLINGTVKQIVDTIRTDRQLKAAVQKYAKLLEVDAIPKNVNGAPDVDDLTREIQALQKQRASLPPEQKKTQDALIEEKKAQRQRLIVAYKDKDEPGHIYHLETNFGLGAAYMFLTHYRWLPPIDDETKAWLSAVGGHNQGPGTAKDLIDLIGLEEYNRQSIEEIFNPRSLSRLTKISTARQEEMLGEVLSVHRCASP